MDATLQIYILNSRGSMLRSVIVLYKTYCHSWKNNSIIIFYYCVWISSSPGENKSVLGISSRIAWKKNSYKGIVGLEELTLPTLVSLTLYDTKETAHLWSIHVRRRAVSQVARCCKRTGSSGTALAINGKRGSQRMVLLNQESMDDFLGTSEPRTFPEYLWIFLRRNILLSIGLSKVI